MSAGSIAVPTIIPLEASQGPKHVIHASTRIEIASGKVNCVLEKLKFILLQTFGEGGGGGGGGG